jgi:hypothetical protein
MLTPSSSIMILALPFIIEVYLWILEIVVDVDSKMANILGVRWQVA